MKTYLLIFTITLGFCSAAIPAEDQFAYIPSDESVLFGSRYAGQKIELILPEHRVDSLVITKGNFYMFRFPPPAFFLEPLNKILQSTSNFSTLTHLPKDSILSWRGYAAISGKPPIRVDMYSRPNCVVLTCGYGSGIVENASAIKKGAEANP